MKKEISFKIKYLYPNQLTWSTQAGQWEMIVESQHSLWIMETFDILVGLREIRRSIRVLKHVHILWYTRNPIVLMLILVKEINISNIVAWICCVAKLFSLFQDPHHQIVPTHVGLMLWHYDLINVEQRYELVLVHIFV